MDLHKNQKNVEYFLHKRTTIGVCVSCVLSQFCSRTYSLSLLRAWLRREKRVLYCLHAHAWDDAISPPPKKKLQQVQNTGSLFYQYRKYPKRLLKLTLGLIRHEQLFLDLSWDWLLWTFRIISVFVICVLYLPSKLEVKPYLVIVSSFDHHYHCSFCPKNGI